MKKTKPTETEVVEGFRDSLEKIQHYINQLYMDHQEMIIDISDAELESNQSAFLHKTTNFLYGPLMQKVDRVMQEIDPNQFSSQMNSICLNLIQIESAASQHVDNYLTTRDINQKIKDIYQPLVSALENFSQMTQNDMLTSQILGLNDNLDAEHLNYVQNTLNDIIDDLEISYDEMKHEQPDANEEEQKMLADSVGNLNELAKKFSSTQFPNVSQAIREHITLAEKLYEQLSEKNNHPNALIFERQLKKIYQFEHSLNKFQFDLQLNNQLSSKLDSLRVKSHLASESREENVQRDLTEALLDFQTTAKTMRSSELSQYLDQTFPEIQKHNWGIHHTNLKIEEAESESAQNNDELSSLSDQLAEFLARREQYIQQVIVMGQEIIHQQEEGFDRQHNPDSLESESLRVSVDSSADTLVSDSDSFFSDDSTIPPYQELESTHQIITQLEQYRNTLETLEQNTLAHREARNDVAKMLAELRVLRDEPDSRKYQEMMEMGREVIQDVGGFIKSTAKTAVTSAFNKELQKLHTNAATPKADQTDEFTTSTKPKNK